MRNLWQLSKYVPAQKLQIEFLNVERNQERYGDDPLSPWQSGIAYSFAVTMFTNPLAWLEVTGLSEESTAILGPMLQVYNLHQSSILNGRVLPIGELPDGTRWTGFQSITSKDDGYLLILREYSPQASANFRLWGLDKGQDAPLLEKSRSALELTPLIKMENRNEVLAEQASLELIPANGVDTYNFELCNPFSFVLYHYKHGKQA
jgi:hypothetical protein